MLAICPPLSLPLQIHENWRRGTALHFSEESSEKLQRFTNHEAVEVFT